MTRSALIIVFVGATLALAAPARAQFDLTWNTIDGGGGTASGGVFTLAFTIGQPDAGRLTGGSFEARCGFWGAGPPTCPADCDGNGQIQPADVACFVNLWFTSLQQGTLAGDFDSNGLVQPADIAVFVSAWFAALTSGC